MVRKFQILPLKQNFLGIGKKFSSFENSKIVILSCPYEKTTTYGKGTAKGPSAILKASHYVEFFDEETVKEICIEKGIAALKPLSFFQDGVWKYGLRGSKPIDNLSAQVFHYLFYS